MAKEGRERERKRERERERETATRTSGEARRGWRGIEKQRKGEVRNRS